MLLNLSAHVCITETILLLIRRSCTANPHVTASARVQDEHVLEPNTTNKHQLSLTDHQSIERSRFFEGGGDFYSTPLVYSDLAGRERRNVLRQIKVDDTTCFCLHSSSTVTTLWSLAMSTEITTMLTLWRPLLPYGYRHEASYARPC